MWFCTLVGGTVWIKCRQSGKCPVCGCEKLCKEYSRPSSKFYALVDSALDCESKLLLARQGGEYISLVLPHHLYCKPNAKWFGCVPLGWSGTGSVIQDQSGSWCIKGIGEYTLVMDSPVSFDAPWWDRSWITDPDPDHPKGTHPLIFGN